MRIRMVIMAVLVLSVAQAAAGIPVPHPGHPRLYVDSTDIPALRQRMASEGGGTDNRENAFSGAAEND